MQLNSYIFIFVFLPVILLTYFVANKVNVKIGKYIIVLGSAIFYIYGGWNIAIIMALSLIINWIFINLLMRFDNQKKYILIFNIVTNVVLLLYFKYLNFFIDSINSIANRDFTFVNLILPLGISFYTFQQIMYVLSVYRNELEKIDLIDYLIYILFFPKLIMGPLAEPEDIILQFNDKNRKKVSSNNMACGLKLFGLGMFKKMVLADTFAIAVEWGFGNINALTSMECILLMLAYTFEIYFDFSGYTDMALGVAKMINIDLPINFDSPYKAISIRDFWKRWHISLTAFLTKNVYIPLGGSKKGKARTYLNTMIVFLVSGFWHGANWTFILWGFLHGLFSVGERVFDKYLNKLIDAVKWIVTFGIINVLWLLFRADSIGQWVGLLSKMFRFQDTSISQGFLDNFILPETTFVFRMLHITMFDGAIRGFSMLLFMFMSLFVCLVPNNNYRNKEKNSFAIMAVAAIALVWSILCLSNESVFVYFNF